MRQQGLILLIYYAKKGCFPGYQGQEVCQDLQRRDSNSAESRLEGYLPCQVASQGIVILVDPSCYFGDLKMSGGNCIASSILGHNCVEQFPAVAAHR